MFKLNSFKNKSKEDKLGIILYIISFIFLLITTYIGLTEMGLWYDEIYSIAFVQQPISKMLEINSIDVHPLLYYFIFKIFAKIFYFIDIEVIGKIVSLIPIYLIGILSVTKVKKNFGYLTSGLFFLCITSMPQMMNYAVEVRMYSLGLFFVTASLIYIYEIIKNPNLKNWAILTILTICSAYTHYFSGISSFILYLLLLIYLFKNEKKELKFWFISSIISVMAFLPWILKVLSQMQTYESGFWIAPITIKTIISYVYFILSPATFFIQSNELVSPTILGTIFLLIILYLIYKIRDKFAIGCIIAFIMLPLIGVLISIIKQPCFHPRFLILAVGCLWLGFSILLAKMYGENKKLFYLFLCVILIVGVIGCINFINIQTQDAKDTEMLYTSLHNNVGSGNIIFIDFFPIEFEGYLLKDNHYIFIGDNIAENIVNALNDPGIKGEIDGGKKVYYFDGGKKNINEVNSTGLALHEIDYNRTLKGTTFDIYRIDV